MKTIVLALSLLAPDGTTSQMPIEMWHFASMAECAKSQVFMNKGKVATAPNYTCVEYDPNENLAIAKTAPQQPAPKRNS